MTTVAFKGGILAGDTLACSQNLSHQVVTKIWRHDDWLFGGAGTYGSVLAVYEWLKTGEGKPDLSGEDSIDAMQIKPHGRGYRIIAWDATLKPFDIVEPFWAVGSGSHLAIGAMEKKASAMEAVKIAMKYDPATGGRIRTLKL